MVGQEDLVGKRVWWEARGTPEKGVCGGQEGPVGKGVRCGVIMKGVWCGITRVWCGAKEIHDEGGGCGVGKRRRGCSKTNPLVW